MTTKRNRMGRLLFGVLLALQASAHGYVIDGDLKDWLAESPRGQTTDWRPRTSPGMEWRVEDQTGGRGTFLDPGYGGQDYDAEAIYVDLLGDDLYIAVVTGRAPGATGYPGGDIALNLGWVAGSLDATFEIGIVTRDHHGFSAGEVYAVTEWYYGLWTAPGIYDRNGISDYKSAHPVGVKSGTKLGTAELVYQVATYGGVPAAQLGRYDGDHYVVETRLNLGALGIDPGEESFLTHWTAWCANDWIQVDSNLPAIPTPPTLILLAVGLLGLGLSGLAGWRAA